MSKIPRVKRKFNTTNAPPVDWLWASVLERQRVYGMTLEEMAQIAGVTYGYMRTMINRSPWDWKKQARENVCAYFGINIHIMPTLDGRLEVNIR